jgi:hypothetical protein
MDLKLRKIHIDSRFKATGTHSDFEYELAETFDCPEGTICYVDNACIPMSWNTIDTTNQYLYIAEKISTTYTVRRLDLTVGYHSGVSLKTLLQAALNANLPTGANGTYTVVHSSNTNTISISSPPNTLFYILTDDDIKYYDNALYSIDKGNPRSANNVLRNQQSDSIVTSAQNFTYNTVWTSQFIDIVNHHSIYVCSSLASFNTLGPRGQSDIICKVPANTSWGSTIFHNVSSAHDFIDVGKRNLSSIRFSLKDAVGNTINLNGASWSLSLVFAIRE